MNDNYEKEKQQLEKMLKNCPDILKPLEARKWMPIGKNAIYDAIKSGELYLLIFIFIARAECWFHIFHFAT